MSKESLVVSAQILDMYNVFFMFVHAWGQMYKFERPQTLFQNIMCKLLSINQRMWYEMWHSSDKEESQKKMQHNISFPPSNIFIILTGRAQENTKCHIHYLAQWSWFLVCEYSNPTPHQARSDASCQKHIELALSYAFTHLLLLHVLPTYWLV